MTINVSLSQVAGLLFGMVLVSFADHVDSRGIKIREIELDDVKNWWDHTDWLHPSRTWRKIRNVVRWVPVLWEDADWDHTYLYRIIEFKLRNMAAHQVEHGHHEECESTAQQMLDAADALRRVREDDYLETEWARYAEGEDRLDVSKWERTPEGHLKMPPLSDEKRVWLRSLSDRHESLVVRDLRLFADAMVEKSRGWWD